MCKCIALVLVVCLVVSSFSVLAVSSVSAQAGYKPSVPQFTVKFIDKSFDVPPIATTTVGPYTGKPITTTIPGYYVCNMSIEVNIKNQPFTPYTDDNGHKINLYYLIRGRYHYEDWCDNDGRLVQSDSECTILTSFADEFVWQTMVDQHGALYDYKVQAVVGYEEYIEYTAEELERMYANQSYWERFTGIPDGYAEFSVVTQSDWSAIQTLTLPFKSSFMPSQTQVTWPLVTSDGDSQPQFPDQICPSNSVFSNPFFLFGVGVLFAGVVIAVVLGVLRKQFKTLQQQEQKMYA